MFVRSPRKLAARRRVPSSRAFSLVEVAMALGIVSFALMSLVGLVPVGLNQFREAIDATVGSQISQRVMTDAQQAEFDELRNGAVITTPNFFVLPLRYFDEQGTEVQGSAPEAVYQVRVRGSQPGPADSSTGSDSFTSLPATSGAERFHPRDSVFLTVQVAQRPASVRLPVNDCQLWKAGTAPISTYTTVIARNGYPTPAKK